MSQDKFSESVLALAGVCQAISCVQSIAKTGQVDQIDADILIESVLKTDTETTEEIYRNKQYLTTGLNTLIQQLSGSKTDADFGRYLINILSLQKHFLADNKMISLMSSRLDTAKRLHQYHDEITPELIEQLANIYKDTISTFNNKIQVSGDSNYLQQPANQAKIRSLLLSAIRSAVLWNQLGGKKRHFLLNKAKILSAAKSHLS